MLSILLAAQFLFMSDRDSFWNPDVLSVDIELMEKMDSPAQKVDFRRFQGKKVLFLVHGFNNSAEDARTTYEAIYSEISPLLDASANPLYDVVIGYFWPGGDERLEYFLAQKNADLLASRVGLHLRSLALFSSQLDVLAHSLGNRVVLDALTSLSSASITPVNDPSFSLIAWLKNRWFTPAKLDPWKPVRNFYSLGAAVDNESIEKNQKYFGATQQCRNMYVFHSHNDDVLKFLYLVADQDRALGLDGSEDLDMTPKNVQLIDCASFVKGHSAYFFAKPLYKFIQNQQARKTMATDSAPHVKLLADGLIAPITQD